MFYNGYERYETIVLKPHSSVSADVSDAAGAVSRGADDHGRQRLRVNADVDGNRRRPVLRHRSPAARPAHFARLFHRHRRRLGGLGHRHAAAGHPPERRRRRVQRLGRSQLRGRLARSRHQTPLHSRQVGRLVALRTLLDLDTVEPNSSRA